MNSRITRAMLDASAELGLFSSALLLLETCLEIGKDTVIEVQQEVGRDFPVFDAICRQGMTPSDIRRRVAAIAADVGDCLEDVKTLVVTSVEIELLDQLAMQYPDLAIRVVVHDGRADRARIESNFAARVTTIDMSRFQDYAHPVESALLVPGYDVTRGRIISTFPTASRILGEDTQYLFSEIIAVDLLGNGLHFFPRGLVELALDHFTQILHIPVYGNSDYELQYEELVG